MAQDSGSSSTPLPVVGCEVEFTPDQQYKVMRSGMYAGLEFYHFKTLSYCCCYCHIKIYLI